MKKEKLAEILKNHESWLREEGGEKANLREADLCEANLYGADLRGADLREANLRGANLREANLCEANLRGADLCEANLYGADLCEANLCEANLSEMILQVGPIGSRKNYTVYFADRDYVQCGCWNDGEGNHLAKFKKRVEKVYPTGQYHDEYMAAIAMLEKLKEMDKEG